jgi:hypothetical protein
MLELRAALAQCLKALIANPFINHDAALMIMRFCFRTHAGVRQVKVLQLLTTFTERPKALIVDTFAQSKVDMHQIRAARTQCPKALCADVSVVMKINMLQVIATCTQRP